LCKHNKIDNLLGGESVFIATVEEQQGKSEFKSGQKICHNQYGRGIIVGFSAFTDEPLVYFYSMDSQQRFGDRLVSVGSETISLIQ